MNFILSCKRLLSVKSLIMVSALSMCSLAQAQQSGTTTHDVAQPFRAIYEISLDTNPAEVSVSDIKGLMVMELRHERCDGYNSTMRMVMSALVEDATMMAYDMRLSSYESRDAQSYNFNNELFINGDLVNSARGAVRKAEDKSLLLESYTQKGETEDNTDTLELPIAYFPIEHTLNLVSHAQNGEKIVQTKIYDGSTGDQGVDSVTSIIGSWHIVDQDHNNPIVSNGQSKGYWTFIDTTYSSQSEESGDEPLSVIKYKLYDNGIADDIHMDFLGTSIIFTLKNIDYFSDVSTMECGQ